MRLVLNVAVAVLLSSVPVGASASLITNGSFETANPSNAVLIAVGGTALTGWQVFNGNVERINFWQASDGSWSIDLDGQPGNAGELRQSFTTTPGVTYVVTFDLSGNPGSTNDTKRLQVSADGQSATFVFDASVITALSDMHYQPQAWSFVADDTSATLSFKSLIGSGWGPVIDNVAVNVPEPAAATLLALAGLASLRRRNA